MGFYPDLLTHVNYRTSGATWATAGTDMLSERDEKAIDVDPVLLRQPVFERDHGALWRSGTHVSPAVGDTMHVNIHADIGLVARNAEHEMSAFGANTMERL
jgi:hypothetical protein